MTFSLLTRHRCRFRCRSLHSRNPLAVKGKIMNEEGKICPSCKSDIGIRPLWPDGKLKCPHCRVKLQYNPLGVCFFSFLLFIYVGIITLACGLTVDLWANRMSIHASMVFWGIVGLCIWFPFGLFAAFHLRNKSKLELYNS